MRFQTFRRALVAYTVLNFVTSMTGFHIIGLPGVGGIALADDGFSFNNATTYDYSGSVTTADIVNKMGGSGGGLEKAVPSQKEIESGESPYTEGREKPKSCKAAQKAALAACSDPYSMAGLGPMGQQAMNQAQQQQQQMNNAAGQSPTMGGSAAACQMAAIMNGLQALMAGLKGVGCTAATKDCEEACKNDPDAYCGNGDSAGAAAALGSVFGLLGAMAGAQACKQMMAQATPTPPAMDCTNPAYAQNNIMCICQADPKNPLCVQREQFPTGLTTTLGDMGPATPSFSDDDALFDDGSPALGLDGKPSVAKGSQTADGGGGAGPQGGRGGFYNPNAERGGGHPRSNIDKNVIQGLAAGSGGASGGIGGGAGGGGGGGGRGGGGDGEGARFDLSKFLPKSKTRGLAGMSISSQDGITGPMGPSLWEKVSKQYQLQRQNMIQDR